MGKQGNKPGGSKYSGSNLSRRRSSVWLNCTDMGNGRAQCNICWKELAYRNGSTYNLKRHMQSKHTAGEVCSKDSIRHPCGYSKGHMSSAILSIDVSCDLFSKMQRPDYCLNHLQWHHGRRVKGGDNCYLFLNFGLSENHLLLKISSKISKFGSEKSPF